MRNFRTILPLCLAVTSIATASAQSRLLLTSQRDHTFRVFDPVTLEQISATVESDDAGHEVMATPDGKTAFVPIYGNAGVGRPGTDGDHIDIYDVATGKLTGTIKFPHGVRPHRPIWNATNGTFLVSAELDKAAAIIDPKTGKILGEIPTGAEQSHMITLLPGGRKLYSANVHPGSVSVMDVPGRKLIKVIPISDNTQRLSCSSDGAYVFTADQTTPDLVVIDTKTDTIKKRVKLPAVGYGSTPTPDGKYVLVAMAGREDIAVVDLKTLEVTKTIPTITGLNEIVVSPDSKWAWASSPKTNSLAKIDLVKGETVKTAPAGKYPDGMWLTQ
jgi:YVTN family beta-propeller protein